MDLYRIIIFLVLPTTLLLTQPAWTQSSPVTKAFNQLQAGQAKQSIKTLKSFLRKNKGNQNAWFIMGNAYQRTQNFKLAAKCFGAVRRLNGPLSNLAILYATSSYLSIPDLRNAYRTLILYQNDPSLAEPYQSVKGRFKTPYLKWAIDLHDQQKYQKSKILLNQLLALDRYPDVLLLMGLVELKLSNKENARNYFKEVSESKNLELARQARELLTDHSDWNQDQAINYYLGLQSGYNSNSLRSGQLQSQLKKAFTRMIGGLGYHLINQKTDRINLSYNFYLEEIVSRPVFRYFTHSLELTYKHLSQSVLFQTNLGVSKESFENSATHLLPLYGIKLLLTPSPFFYGLEFRSSQNEQNSATQSSGGSIKHYSLLTGILGDDWSLKTEIGLVRDLSQDLDLGTNLTLPLTHLGYLTAIRFAIGLSDHWILKLNTRFHYRRYDNLNAQGVKRRDRNLKIIPELVYNLSTTSSLGLRWEKVINRSSIQTTAVDKNYDQNLLLFTFTLERD